MYMKLGKRLKVIAAALWLGLGTVLFGVGGDDPSRVSLSGTINLAGKPLEGGMIYFVHTSQSPPQVLGAGHVQQGRFAIGDHDFLVPGTYRVRVSGLDSVLIPEAQPTNAALPTDPIPERFSRNSQIEVVIPHGGTFQLDFDLKP